MIKNEYLRFLQTLSVEDVSSGVRKIANLILEHLDELLPLGTAQGRRAKKVADLASNNWNVLSSNIEEVDDQIENAEEAIKQLKSIKIGPFRGFSKEETLDLLSSIVLIYGPNGTGKSSFCEALEYGLLGSVEEAQSKRFTNQQSYLKNARVDQFVAPVIEGINNKDEIVVVSPNESSYRFCFVEKNRIDNFSRIAAHAPAKQTELISSLFGLGAFNEFVKNFSRELDYRHMDLTGKKSELLKQKQQVLDVHKQTIDNNKQFLAAQVENEAKLSHQFKNNASFSEMVTALGTNENPGKIHDLEAKLQKKQLPITGLTVLALEESKATVESAHQELIDKLAELSKASEGLSFKQLFGAVLDLQDVSEDKCPACRSPLAQVAQDPYQLATAELAKLGHLAQLEQDRDQLHTSFVKAVKSVYLMVEACFEHSDINKEVNSLRIILVENEAQLDWAWWQVLEPGSEEMASHWWLLNDQVQKLQRRDAEINKANKERTLKQARLNELRKFKEETTKLLVKRSTIEESTQTAAAAIRAFDEENKELIAEAEAEKAVITTNQQIAKSYNDFMNMLLNYTEQLPSKLVADLGDLVVQLYNAFNRNDAPKDLLASIKLPLAPGQHIEIAYQSEPEKIFDALHILSEGHIRCIGLAILLAKNLKTNSPLLIFDDPVNAIDDEHRSAIRETLFQDGYFKERQIILACHGNEFFKDIHQLIGKKAAQESESYKFLPQAGENHVQISSLKRPTNYVLAATELLGEAEYRDALMSSRRALEYLCAKTWKHYGKYSEKSDGLISVSRRSPDAPWDLRALSENLKSKMNKSRAEIPNHAKIVDAFDKLLGVSGQDPHWVYLNKGTHEEADREEFEHATVTTIVESINALDEALT
jgi:DNA sulfur modification protein DndD